MHIDMLGVAGAGVTLVLATVLLNQQTTLNSAWPPSLVSADRRGVADDEAGGGLVAPVADDHGAAPLPVVGDDLPVVIPEYKRWVQVKRAGLKNKSSDCEIDIQNRLFTCIKQVRLMVDPFSMYLSFGPRTMVLGWMTPRYILCSMCGVVLT